MTNRYAKAGRPPRPNSTSVIHECRRHGWTIHHRYDRGDGSPRYRCKRCVGEAVTRRHRQIKRRLVEAHGGGCVICGYDRCVTSLHFHHVDPATKAFPITMARGRSLDAYLEEARKCVLVCANCHGEIESGLIPSPEVGAKLAG